MEGFTEEGRVVQARVQTSNALLLLNYNVSSVAIVESVTCLLSTQYASIVLSASDY